ncbi:monocarboxylate transporter 12-like [Tropilaelaps mercedesae]|uniref:Monocarboxylate transporter 12-like n=1 Tax=Tropilaelaps mercedesae TaxID=418985 RepID=A0A1V9XHA1_9ACAR|nr:monocarboxylate transporter 12-like [Tropilaelaps mercedesae]
MIHNSDKGYRGRALMQAAAVSAAKLRISGPIAGVMEKVMSIRAIVTWGVFIASLSCVLCYVAYDVTTFVLLIGGLYGVGTGLTCTLTPVLLNERFPPEQRTLACGIAYSGSTVGSFFWPYLLEWLILEVNLRGSMLIYGGLILHALVGSIFLRRSSNPITDTVATPASSNGINKEAAKKMSRGSTASSEVLVENGIESNRPEAKIAVVTVTTIVPHPAKETSVKALTVTSSIVREPPLSQRVIIALQRDLSVLGDPFFQLVTISAVCFFFVYVTVFIIIPDYAMDNGISKTEAMFLITIFGISDLISKPLPGMLTYKNFLSTKALLILGSVSMGAICFILPHTSSYLWFSVITFLYGLLTGGLVFLSPILITENIPMDRAPVAFGLSNFFVGVTGFLRPRFIGYFKDTFHNYNGLFYAMGALCMASAALWIFEPLIRRRKERRDLQHKTNVKEFDQNTSDLPSPEVDPLVSA